METVKAKWPFLVNFKNNYTKIENRKKYWNFVPREIVEILNAAIKPK